MLKTSEPQDREISRTTTYMMCFELDAAVPRKPPSKCGPRAVLDKVDYNDYKPDLAFFFPQEGVQYPTSTWSNFSPDTKHVHMSSARIGSSALGH